MADKEYPTQSVVLDAETKEQLKAMAITDDRTESAVIRTLIRAEFARRQRQAAIPPNPIFATADWQIAHQDGQE
jgi:hypothetical protein